MIYLIFDAIFVDSQKRYKHQTMIFQIFDLDHCTSASLNQIGVANCSGPNSQFFAVLVYDWNNRKEHVLKSTNITYIHKNDSLSQSLSHFFICYESLLVLMVLCYWKWFLFLTVLLNMSCESWSLCDITQFK